MSVDSALGRLAGVWEPEVARPGDSLWRRLFPPRPRREIPRRAPKEGELVLLVAGDVSAPALRDGRRLGSTRPAAPGYLLERAGALDEVALDALLRETRPRVLIADVEVCAVLGLASVRSLRRTHPATDWLLGWSEPSPRWIETAIHAQASGAIAWGIDADELARALDAVTAGELWFSRRVMQWLYASMLSAARSDGPMSLPAESRPPAGMDLTAREAEVLALMRQGLTNKQIADRLGISINTVKKHLQSAFEKRGLRSRRQVVG